MRGVEPPHLSAPDPKSGVSANFTTSAFLFVESPQNRHELYIYFLSKC